jgi:hypothetical protein
VNVRLIAWCRERKADGFGLMLWSARGMAYAQHAADVLSIRDLFDVICGKPGYVVDDQGWNWIKHTHIVRSFDAEVGKDVEIGQKSLGPSQP